MEKKLYKIRDIVFQVRHYTVKENIVGKTLLFHFHKWPHKIHRQNYLCLKKIDLFSTSLFEVKIDVLKVRNHFKHYVYAPYVYVRISF